MKFMFESVVTIVLVNMIKPWPLLFDFKLGITVVSNSIFVTDTLATQLIENVMNQSIAGVNSFLTRFADQANAHKGAIIVNENPAFTTELARLDGVAFNTPNVTLTALNMVRHNPFVAGITSVSCSTSPTGKCTYRVYRNATAGKSLYQVPIDPITGADVGPLEIITASNAYLPDTAPKYQTFYHQGYKFWAIQLKYPYQPVESINDPTRKRYCRAGIEMQTTLSAFFKSIKPTVNSILYMVDDLGFIVVSSENGTMANTPSNNINSVIASTGKSLIAEAGNITNVPNNYLKTVMLDGTKYILASKDFQMPSTSQINKVVMVVPYLDFYGTTESSTTKALVIALVIVGIVSSIGVVFVAGLSLLAVLPLRRMANSMRELTKFDFSVLENGKLESTSIVSEFNLVESTFLKMVKAFAYAIRESRTLKSDCIYSEGTNSTPRMTAADQKEVGNSASPAEASCSYTMPVVVPSGSQQKARRPSMAWTLDSGSRRGSTATADLVAEVEATTVPVLVAIEPLKVKLPDPVDPKPGLVAVGEVIETVSELFWNLRAMQIITTCVDTGVIEARRKAMDSTRTRNDRIVDDDDDDEVMVLNQTAAQTNPAKATTLTNLPSLPANLDSIPPDAADAAVLTVVEACKEDDVVIIVPEFVFVDCMAVDANVAEIEVSVLDIKLTVSVDDNTLVCGSVGGGGGTPFGTHEPLTHI
ncbi:hypothetical protein HDU76_004547 [Blyttiomyces sp. JEL0837]|nr:hypothetical protein HDU76_004547 [Blyttiomyces sp. JEL0837]